MFMNLFEITLYFIFRRKLFYLVKPIFNENSFDIKNAVGKIKRFIRKCYGFICMYTYIYIFYTCVVPQKINNLYQYLSAVTLYRKQVINLSTFST